MVKKDALLEDGEIIRLFSQRDERAIIEINRIIDHYLRQTTDRRRYVFVERYYFGKAIKEIAADLFVSVGTVKRELAEIRNELKKAFSNGGIEP